MNETITLRLDIELRDQDSQRAYSNALELAQLLQLFSVKSTYETTQEQNARFFEIMIGSAVVLNTTVERTRK